jgi:hypothetical protein
MITNSPIYDKCEMIFASIGLPIAARFNVEGATPGSRPSAVQLNFFSFLSLSGFAGSPPFQF